jgi:proteasome lid subunit RPN8/RPN11
VEPQSRFSSAAGTDPAVGSAGVAGDGVEHDPCEPAWPKSRPLRHPRDGWQYRPHGRIDPDLPQLVILDSALKEAYDYSFTDLRREVGGLLVGGYYVDETLARPQHYVEIIGFVPALKGESGSGSFKFTHESWTEARRESERRFGDGLIFVGWHHTHPGISVFLSGLDRFIHNSYFSEPWMTALVVDPRSREFEFFRIRDGRVEACGFQLMSRADTDSRPDGSA